MQDKNYFIKVHGHSCLEFRSNETCIIFDPWLSSSAYWRSWWNFPGQPPLSLLLRIFLAVMRYLFLTHLHWDHFHGPTLKKYISKFLI